MEYRKATICDIDAVEAFYGDVIDNMKDSPYSPGWTRGIYPSRKMLIEFIEENAMTLGLEDQVIMTSFNLNTRSVEEWKLGHWSEYDEKYVSALHTLAVRPGMQRKGLGVEAVRKAIEVARNEGFRTIRLDVAAHNTIARRMYEKAGFTYLETITIEYAVGGQSSYALYEYEIK